jgi:hypothetical protein
VSEQNAEQSSVEPGSLGAGPAISGSPDVQSEPVVASAPGLGGTDSHLIAPDHEAPKADVPRAEAPKAEAPKVEAAEPAASRTGGKLMIMSHGDRSFDGNEADAKTESERASGMFGKRRAAALAAVVVLAAVSGAIGGAMATAGYAHFVGGDAASAGNGAIEASVARIDADMLALKASVEHTSRTGIAQFNKTSDRLDKVEKAQAEPAAKLAKLSEAVDKLRAAPPAAPVPVAAAAPVAPKEVTGSIVPAAATPAAAPKVELARLPAVDGWVLRDVGYGGALIESRRGTYEVYAGDMIPGLGRIDAIRRQDGHWVVVTSKGLIVTR